MQEVLLFKELFSKRIVLCCSKRGFSDRGAKGARDARGGTELEDKRGIRVSARGDARVSIRLGAGENKIKFL